MGTHLSVLMTAPSQGHDKDPSRDHFTGKDIGDPGSAAEVHLGSISELKIENNGGLGLMIRQSCKYRLTAE